MSFIFEYLGCPCYKLRHIRSKYFYNRQNLPSRGNHRFSKSSHCELNQSSEGIQRIGNFAEMERLLKRIINRAR